MDNKIEATESESFMGYTLSREVATKVAELALGMVHDEVVIPDTDGQVLVRDGTVAFSKRQNDVTVFKIPVILDALVDGVLKKEKFFVCSK